MEKFDNNLNNSLKENKIRNNYNVLDGVRTFFYVLAINILASVFYMILMSVINIFYKGSYADLIKTPFACYVALLIVPLSFFGVFLVYNKVNHINAKSAVASTKKFNVWSLVITFALVGITIVGFMPIINMILTAFTNAGIGNLNSNPMFPMNTWWRIILGFVAYAVLPAIAEELLFRGIMLRGFSRRASGVASVMLSAVMFCLMHGSLQQTFYQLILGVMLGFVAYYTGNILFSMIFHFLNNAIVVLLELVGGYNSFLNGFSQNFGGYMFAIAIAVMATIVAVLFIWLLKKINKHSETEDVVVEGDTIIVEQQDKKLGFKEFVLSFDFNEKFYFYSSLIVGLIIWICNSF